MDRPESRRSTFLLFVLLMVMVWVTISNREPTRHSLRSGPHHLCAVMGLALQTAGTPYINTLNGTWSFLEANTLTEVHGRGAITCIAIPPADAHQTKTVPQEKMLDAQENQ